MNTEEEFENAYNIVNEILMKHPECRNSYKWLMIRIWQRQCPGIFIPYNEINNLISPETITRACRKIQHDEMRYIPTDPEIIKLRRIRQREVADWSQNH